MKVFLDTNVLIDYLNKREPFFAESLWIYAYPGKWRVYCRHCPLSMRPISCGKLILRIRCFLKCFGCQRSLKSALSAKNPYEELPSLVLLILKMLYNILRLCKQIGTLLLRAM